MVAHDDARRRGSMTRESTLERVSRVFLVVLVVVALLRQNASRGWRRVPDLIVPRVARVGMADDDSIAEARRLLPRVLHVTELETPDRVLGGTGKGSLGPGRRRAKHSFVGSELRPRRVGLETARAKSRLRGDDVTIRSQLSSDVPAAADSDRPAGPARHEEVARRGREGLYGPLACEVALDDFDGEIERAVSVRTGRSDLG